MRATLRQQCVPGRSQHVDAIDIELSFEIPFVPPAGTMVAANDGGDFLKVDEVFWHAEEPDHLEIYVKDGETLRPLSYWKQQGWRRSKA